MMKYVRYITTVSLQHVMDENVPCKGTVYKCVVPHQTVYTGLCVIELLQRLLQKF
jgi:hypothetical protein